MRHAHWVLPEPYQRGPIPSTHPTGLYKHPSPKAFTEKIRFARSSDKPARTTGPWPVQPVTPLKRLRALRPVRLLVASLICDSWSLQRLVLVLGVATTAVLLASPGLGAPVQGGGGSLDETCLFYAPNAPSGTYYSHINWQFEDPSDLGVVVVPPAYVSEEGVFDDLSWLSGGDPVNDYPGVQVVLEVIDYWEWILDQHAERWPVLEEVRWTTRVVGVDATPVDVATADIVVLTGAVADPGPLPGHAGIGQPVPCVASPTQEKCLVINTTSGSRGDEVANMRLRNLAIHEFGHCLSAGHTYNGSGGSPLGENDVMASIDVVERQCISNLNVQSIAEGYRFLVDAGAAPGSGWTTMPAHEYAQDCIPAGLERY